MKIESNIIYKYDTDCDPKWNSLDIYYQSRIKKEFALKNKVVVYIHGGNWSTGDKAFPDQGETDSTSLPHWFVDQGYVFVSINFRLAENNKNKNATVADMLSDIAKALKWLTVNVRRYGGKVDSFVLLGYSSGGHLASLIATDLSYLKSYRIDSTIIRGVILMDTAHFDIPLVIDQLRHNGFGFNRPIARVNNLIQLMGKLPSLQKRLSPVYHVGPLLRDTYFLLLTAGRYEGQKQTLTFDMNQKFKKRLESFNINVKTYHFENKDHSCFVDMVDDEILEKVIEFFRVIG